MKKYRRKYLHMSVWRSWKKQMEWNKKIRSMVKQRIPEEVPLKVFKPKRIMGKY